MCECIEGKVFYLAEDNEYADYNCPDCEEGILLEIARLSKRIAAFKVTLAEIAEDVLWKSEWAKQLRQAVADHAAQRDKLAKEINGSR